MHSQQARITRRKRLAGAAGSAWGVPWAGGQVAIGDFSTNDFAQRGLAIIALLAVAPDEAP
jgi:hypothetical protein